MEFPTKLFQVFFVYKRISLHTFWSSLRRYSYGIFEVTSKVSLETRPNILPREHAQCNSLQFFQRFLSKIHSGFMDEILPVFMQEFLHGFSEFRHEILSEHFPEFIKESRIFSWDFSWNIFQRFPKSVILEGSPTVTKDKLYKTTPSRKYF